MDLADQIIPKLKGYVKANDSFDSKESVDDRLEKQILLGNESYPIWQPVQQRHSPAVIFHTLLILSNITFAFLFYTWTITNYSHGPNIRYTPLRDSIQYEERVFELDGIYLSDHKTLNLAKPTRFNGPPSAELEAEWDELVKYQNLRLTKEELGERADDVSLVELPDGGYFGTLAVFHSLHCVRRLHHMLYMDSYYPNISSTDYQRLKAHADHCIDTLRQNIQCGADTTIQALHWGSRTRYPLGHDDFKHECVNWENVNNWAKEHSFSPMEPGYLSHPTLGLSYPDGKIDPLGIVVDHILGTVKGEIPQS